MRANLSANLTCPHCGARISESISSDACVVSFQCPTCEHVLAPIAGDGCVFCSHGDAGCCTEEYNPARCLPDPNHRYHVVLGVSPFNSYYSERRLTNLLAWSTSHFERADAFIPDTPTMWTLEAGGYPKKRAAKKTRRQIRYLTNKLTRALDSTDANNHRITVLPWSEMSEYTTYQTLYKRCRGAFEHDIAFRQACLDATDEVLENRKRDTHEPGPSDRLRAVDYLMAELPVILFAPELLDVPSSTFIYHRSLPLFEQLFSGAFSIKPSPSQHFVIANEC